MAALQDAMRNAAGRHQVRTSSHRSLPRVNDRYPLQPLFLPHSAATNPVQ